MSCLMGMKLRVLFLASWYPNEEHPVSGIFVRRHALAVSKFCYVAVLYVHRGEVENSVKVSKEEGLLEIKVYRKAAKYHNPWLKWFYEHIWFYMEYLWGGYLGYRIVEKELGKPDLSHVNVITYAGVIGLALKLLKGIPYVVTEHWAGYFDEDRGFNKSSSFSKQIIRIVGNNARAITTVSCSLRNAMLACGVKNRYFVIPNVVDVQGQMGNTVLEGSKKKIIHVSLLRDDIKNVSGIIEAAAALRSQRDDFEILILGDGPDRGKLEDLAKKLDLMDGTVFFQGMVDSKDVSRFLRISQFSILNSNFETFSVFAAESLACGKPIITTRCQGPEEFVDDRCGVLVEPKDIKGLAKAMEYMLDNFSKYDPVEISRYAEGKFSSAVVGKQILEVYKKALNSTC